MHQLDRIDYEILEHLSNNARLSNKDLAKKLGVAPSTCFERTRILREEKILRGFHAEVDIDAIGISLNAMVVVRLDSHSRKLVDSFNGYAISLTEVTAVYHLSGANDFLVMVAVGNTAELREFVLDAFTERPEVAHVETSLIYEQKRKFGIPRNINKMLEK